MKKLFLVLVSVVLVINSYTQYKQSFNSTWQFAKEMDSVFPEKLLSIDSDVSWERVSLPHTANIEPVEKGTAMAGHFFLSQILSYTCRFKRKTTSGKRILLL